MPVSSAFQPYKRPPDPFVSAPFDHVPETPQKRQSGSSSSSITPTKSMSHYSSKKTARTKSKAKKANESVFDPNQTPRSEDLNDKNVSTPIASSKKSHNPFINAPFTAKKCKAITVLQSQVPASSSLSSINSTNGLTPTNPKPTVIQRLPFTVEQKSQIHRQLSGENTDSQKQSINKIPQSQSLNEIKAIKQNNELENVETGKLRMSQEPNQVFKQKIEILDARVRNEEVASNVKKSLVNQMPESAFKRDVNQIPKSNSANLGLFNSNSETNNNNNNSVTKSLNPGGSSKGGGGIANMSFDDY